MTVHMIFVAMEFEHYINLDAYCFDLNPKHVRMNNLMNIACQLYPTIFIFSPAFKLTFT